MKQSRRNHRNAWGYFVATGGIPKDAKPFEWCLHHVDTTLKFTDPQRYDEWRIEDLVPMRMGDHVALHWTDEKSKALRAQRIGDAHRGKPGHAQSEETRQKLRTANLGKVLSEETRRKISEAGKGRPCGEETRMKRSASMKGHEVGEETRLKISAALKGKKRGAQSRELVARRAEAIRDALADPEKRKEISRRVSDLVWITDGTSCARIPKGAALPEGWRPGRTLSDHAKKAMGRPGIARGPMDDATRKKISDARKGMKFSDEHRRHLSESRRRG